MANVIYRIISGDAVRRVTFRVDGKGLYSWCEEALNHSIPEEPLHPFEWWAPSNLSGLYDTLTGAQADATAELPWLRNEPCVTPPPTLP